MKEGCKAPDYIQNRGLNASSTHPSVPTTARPNSGNCALAYPLYASLPEDKRNRVPGCNPVATLQHQPLTERRGGGVWRGRARGISVHIAC